MGAQTKWQLKAALFGLALISSVAIFSFTTSVNRRRRLVAYDTDIYKKGTPVIAVNAMQTKQNGDVPTGTKGTVTCNSGRSVAIEWQLGEERRKIPHVKSDKDNIQTMERYLLAQKNSIRDILGGIGSDIPVKVRCVE